MTTTTQDLRALIARLQARLGGTSRVLRTQLQRQSAICKGEN